MKKEINNICYECGASANVLTSFKKYGKRPHRLSRDTIVINRGECDICEKRSHLMDPNHFYFPDFDLLINATLK